MAVINSKIFSSLFLLGLLSFTACEESVQSGDELTPGEREYIRRRAAEKCINNSNGDIEDFYKNSNNKMLDFQRNDTWELKYSKGETEIDTSYLYVWKVDPPIVYFRLRLEDGSSFSNQYIKFDTTTNEEMVLNLQNQGCTETDDNLSYTLGNSRITVKRELPRVTEDSETESETDISYTFESGYPAFIGVYNRTETKRFYDEDDDDTVTKTDKFTYTIKRISDVAQPATFDDSDVANREYCVVKYTNASPLNTYTFPFELTCVTSTTNGPDGNGDSTEDFDPATELPL